MKPLREKLTYKMFIQLYKKENKSLEEIGELYQVSRQRVHQLKKEYENIHGSIVRRKVIDPLTLKKFLDRNFTVEEIANRFNLNRSRVTRMIAKYQNDFEKGVIPIKLEVKKSTDIISAKDLDELYNSELLTDHEIGKIYGFSPSLVNSLRKKYGIHSRKSKSYRKLPKKLTREVFLDMYFRKNKSVKEIAEQFDSSIYAVLQLKKEYLSEEKGA